MKDIADDVVVSINYAFVKVALSVSQKRGIITLLPKKGNPVVDSTIYFQSPFLILTTKLLPRPFFIHLKLAGFPLFKEDRSLILPRHWPFCLCHNGNAQRLKVSLTLLGYSKRPMGRLHQCLITKIIRF